MSTDAIEALLETTARERESAIPRNGSQEADRGHDHGRRSSDSDRDRERDRYPTHGGDRRGDRDRDRGGRSREHHRDREYRDRDGDRYQPGRSERDYDRSHRDRSIPHSSRSGDEGDRHRHRHDVYVPNDSRRLSRERSRSPPRGDSFRPSRGGNRHRQRSPMRKRTPEPTEDERDRRTIFVQQLAARLRTRELIEFFSKVGPVKDAQIVKDRVSNRSKGVGYVEFRDEESVPKAIQLTGKTLKGIPIIAQLTEAEKNRQARVTEGTGNANNGVPYHRLYVGNIHFSITEEDLRSVFEPFGELEFVQLQKEETGRSKGYGFVQFHTSKAAKDALEQLNGFELANRPIRVGLGNDKFTAESTANLLRNFNAPHGQYQGSSFSGSGGRGATAGGSSGTFDRAGGRDDRGTGGASALDDTDVAGVNFNNYSREALMQKLMHRAEKHPGQEGSATSSKLPTTIVSSKKQQDYTGFAMASRCVKISNAFDPEEEKGDWIKEIESEMREELSKIGKVIHVRLDPNSIGDVYIKFDKVSDGEKAVQRLNGRLYNSRMLTAAPMADKIYDSINSTRRVSSDNM